MKYLIVLVFILTFFIFFSTCSTPTKILKHDIKLNTRHDSLALAMNGLNYLLEKNKMLRQDKKILSDSLNKVIKDNKRLVKAIKSLQDTIAKKIKSTINLKNKLELEKKNIADTLSKVKFEKERLASEKIELLEQL